MKVLESGAAADGRLVVQRLVPAFEATIRTSRPCEIIRSRLQALPHDRRLTITFDPDDTFTIRSLRRGLRARLQPRFTGRLLANAQSGCDIALHLAWPRTWWTFALTLFALLVWKSFAAVTLAERVTLLSGLVVLTASTFLPLWWRAWRVARSVRRDGVVAA